MIEVAATTVPVRMMREWHGQEDSMRLFGVLSPVLATIVIHEGIALDDDGNQYTWNRWSLEHALSVATILGAARLSARDEGSSGWNRTPSCAGQNQSLTIQPLQAKFDPVALASVVGNDICPPNDVIPTP